MRERAFDLPAVVWVVGNRTPYRVELVLPAGVLALAPLEERKVDLDPEVAEWLMLQWELRGEIEVLPSADDPVRGTLLGDTLMAALVVAVLWALAAPAVGPDAWPWWGPAVGLVAGGWVTFTLLSRRWWLVVGAGRRVARAVRRTWDRARALYAWAGQAALLLGAVTVGLVLPGVAIYHGTELRLLAPLDRPWPTVGGDATFARMVVVGRALQVLFIAVASLLPALMYFQFDRERLTTLRERWMRQMFRLDDRLRTVRDLEAKHGRQMTEILGGSSSGRLPTGRRSPIFVATVVLVIGWVFVLLNPAFARRASAALGGDEIGTLSLAELVTPELTAVNFAFLGAYFFAIHLVAQAYMRGDLRPKTYTTITVRVLAAAILAWVLNVLLAPQPTVFAASFLAGIVPETALRLVRDRMRARRWLRLDEGHPLTDLDGIDLYERTRLGEEGITNVQALAHSDLIGLTLSTRIPLPRIVDWVDQAILYLHVVGPDVAGDDREDRLVRLCHLRRFGIRGVTDLLRAVEAAEERGRSPDDVCRELLGDDPAGGPPLRSIVDVVRDGDWVRHLSNWHRRERLDRVLRYEVPGMRPAAAPVPVAVPASPG